MLGSSSLFSDEVGGEPLLPRRPLHNHSEFDITAMIDLVFMMNIYFLVTTITAALADIDLPSAQHCFPADREAAVVITMLAPRERQVVGVVIGDDTETEPLTDPSAQQREVLRAVEEGVRLKMKSVIVRAEKEVPLRELMRVVRVVATVEGMQLKVSVVEKE